MTMHSAHNDPVEVLAAALRDSGQTVRRSGQGYVAQCPAHDDRNPSLSINHGNSGAGKALIYCFAGCDWTEILAALNLSPGHLFAEGALKAESDAKRLTLSGQDRGQVERGDRRGAAGESKVVAVYDYVWPNSEPCTRVTKYQEVDQQSGTIKKSFRQQRWDPDRDAYVWGLDGLDVPLYHADAVAEAISRGETIVVCEGEKDADEATDAWEVVATTNPMGAGSWRQHHSDALKGAKVVVIADDDAAGRRHASDVVRALSEVASEVTLMLPTLGPDVADHLAAGGTWDQLREVTADEVLEDDHTGIRATYPALDWQGLWTDTAGEEWILAPLLPARRLVSVYSVPKLGKSLLMLEIAVGISRGVKTLGFDVPRPRRVLYVDFENDPKADVRSRLQAMGYGPDDLANLVYLSFPPLTSMDSAAGGRQLLNVVKAYNAEVVVIDTVSRAVEGKENENDTWLAFYRHTGLSLKKAGVALIRLDHSGKDPSRGQRGGSAKSGDVDAVWHLKRVDEMTFSLQCEDARFPLSEEERKIILRRRSEPHLHHEVIRSGDARSSMGVSEVAAWLDEQGLPNDLSVRVAAEKFREAGNRASQEVIAEACRQRKKRGPAD